MYFGVTTLLVIITLLSIVSLQGASKYRNLTKSINQRSTEIPLAIELGIAVSDLRSQLWDANRKQQEIQPYWEDVKPKLGGRDPLWQINLEAKIKRTRIWSVASLPPQCVLNSASPLVLRQGTLLVRCGKQVLSCCPCSAAPG